MEIGLPCSASREVIVCCGAIESPKLLMLSGIGNPEHLKQFNIPVRVGLPGIGENFHDHPLVIGPIGRMAEPGQDPRGNMTEIGLFWRSMPGMLVPDLEICLVHKAPFGEAFFANVVQRLQTGQPYRTRAATGGSASNSKPAWVGEASITWLGAIAK